MKGGLRNMSKQATVDSFDGLAKDYIKGSDVKTDTAEFIVQDVKIENPEPNKNVLTLEILYEGNASSFALNATNTKKVREFVKSPKELIGKKVFVKKVLATNPDTREEVESLRITKVE